MADEYYEEDDWDQEDSSDSDEEPGPSWQATFLVEIVMVAMALLGTLLVWPLIAFMFFVVSGIPAQLYGEDYVRAAQDPNSPIAQQASIRINLWTIVAGFPVQAVILPLFFWLVNRTRPEEMNLTTRRAGWYVLMGVGVWLLITPLTLALHYLATITYDWLVPSGTEPHVFEQLVRGNELWPVEKGLLVVAAMVVAPVIEELVFRGVLLRWARRQPYASDAIVAVALVACLPTSEAGWRAVMQMADVQSVLHPLAPLIWGLLVFLVYGVVRWHWPEGAAARIIATALLFASFHGAWPSPVALFFLALGLGYLAEKTDSLVGPITVHCLFNGVACVQMFVLPEG